MAMMIAGLSDPPINGSATVEVDDSFPPLPPLVTFIKNYPFPNFIGVGDYAYHTRALGPYSQTFVTDKFNQHFFVRSFGISKSAIGAIQEGYGWMNDSLMDVYSFQNFFTGSGYNFGFCVIFGLNWSSSFSSSATSMEWAIGPTSFSVNLTWVTQVK